MDQPSPEQFLQACGMTAPLQFEIEHAERGERVQQTFSRPFVLVGRDERADLRLGDKRVSHRHAYLQVVAGRLWYVDLDSRTGTLTEDGRLAPGPLNPGQRLRIGPYLIRLAGGGKETASGEVPLPNPLNSDSFDPAAGPTMGLDFLAGAAKQPLWVVDRPLTLVGRSDQCRVRLHSPTVSRMHCALLHTPAGLWAIDLLGRDGIAVNGTPIRRALLADADELRIGQFVIRVCCLDRTLQQSVKGLPLALQRPAQSSLGEVGNAGQLTPGPSAVAPTAEAGGMASLLPSLVSQFGLMQQQMFDQFQQTLMTIVQMFGNLHRDQLQIVQREIDQLRELTRELQGVEARLARQPTRPADVPRTLSLLQPSAPAIPSSPRRARGSAHAAPAPAATPRARGETKRTAAASGPSVPPSSESSLQSDLEVHAWLNQRLVEIQQERQSRWQKILQVVTGK